MISTIGRPRNPAIKAALNLSGIFTPIIQAEMIRFSNPTPIKKSCSAFVNLSPRFFNLEILFSLLVNGMFFTSFPVID
jgi:hypothetical protein